MASGTKIVSAVTVSDTSLPLLNSDLAMPSASSLAAKGLLGIWDMNHSAVPTGSGVASGLAVQNVAWAEAAALLGSGSQSSLAAALGYDTGYVAGTTAQLERSGKGGLHGIISQTNNGAADQGAGLLLPTAVITYLGANSAHQYFVSMWARITRAALTGATPVILAALSNNASGDTNYFTRFKANGDGSSKILGSDLGSASLLAGNTLGNDYYESGKTGFTGSFTSSLFRAGAFWGTTSKSGAAQNGTSGNFNKMPSWIFYRMHLEDLTVSGRSFAQASAADQAAYNLAFATGGRFASDTFTAPAI